MRALICGAGIAGLTLACLLDHMGWDVQLVERWLAMPARLSLSSPDKESRLPSPAPDWWPQNSPTTRT
jgi:glycine/D-amino acid oxidase-like deaminating enzyme